MADDTIQIAITADGSGLDSGLADAQKSIGKSAAEIANILRGIGKESDNAAQKIRESHQGIADEYAGQAASAEAMKDLHQLSATEEIQELRRVEDERHKALQQALQEDAECAVEAGKAHAAALAQKEADTVKYNAKTRALNLQEVKATEAAWEANLAPINHAFESTIQGIISGQQTLNQAIAKAAQSMVTQFADAAVKRVTNWIASEIAMTEVTETQTALRTSAEAAGQGTSLALHYDTAIKKIGSAAAEAYSGVFAWASPELGPFAAVPAAAAAALIFAKEALIPSAAGGWDIPAGINPMTQLHEREMVLPASIADPLRNSIASGGGTGGGDIHIHAVDAASFQRLLTNNKSGLAKALRAAARGFDPALA